MTSNLDSDDCGFTDGGVESESDRWSRWLLQDRFGGNGERQREVMSALLPIRDRVLTGAQLQDQDIVLDVGCGDGLLGFAALDRIAPDGQVVFSDVSTPLLARCRQIAADTGVEDRCQFVAAALPELDEIADQAVDVAVMRSVLIYVAEKRTAFTHLHRVLRLGGRLSLFEPINSFSHPEPANQLWGFDVTGVHALAEQVKTVMRTSTNDQSTLHDFDERDLMTWAVEAGFDNLLLDSRNANFCFGRRPEGSCPMSAPLPKDPLDEPIAEFVRAVDEFLSMKLDLEPPDQIAPLGPNSSWEDVKRVWEESKRVIRKAHASFVGVQPEVTERLELVAVKGSIVLELTDDPHIVGPINDLMRLMSEVRAEISRLESTLGKAASVLGFVTLILEMAGLKTRLVPLSAQIVAARDALIAYNLMRTPPRDSA